MKRYWLVALALPALAVACGEGDDTIALQTQLAALRTQVSEPTATMTTATPTVPNPTAVSTPKGDQLRAACRAESAVLFESKFPKESDAARRNNETLPLEYVGILASCLSLRDSSSFVKLEATAKEYNQKVCTILVADDPVARIAAKSANDKAYLTGVSVGCAAIYPLVQ